MYLLGIELNFAGTILLPHAHLRVGTVPRLPEHTPHADAFEQLLRLAVSATTRGSND